MSQKFHALSLKGPRQRLSSQRERHKMPFAAQTMPLGQLLANPYIVHTPPYQRSYPWEPKEANRLLEDLLASFDADNGRAEFDDYFLGTMLFIEVDRPAARRSALSFSRPMRVLEVVDGLQRLTTLTILLCLLRDLDAQDGLKANDRVLAAIATGQRAGSQCRFELREPDEAFFHAHIRKSGATRNGLRAGDAASASQDRILEARDHILQALRDLEPAQRKRLADFVLDKCQVVVVSTTGIDRAHRIFTVLNARGKPLARNDILKADLLGSIPAPARERATAIWDGAKARLDSEFDNLFSHIRTSHGRGSAPIISSIRSIAEDAGGAQAFIEQVLQPAANAFHDILKARHTGTEHSASISALLAYLSWVRGQSDWVPPLLLWWMTKCEDPAELLWFIRALDRLAYGLRILSYGGRRRASRFTAIVRAIREGRDLRGPHSPLSLTRDELRTIQHNLRDLHARSSPIAKLVLLRINDHMAGKPQPVPHENLSIEHVLPRKPSPNSAWRASFADPNERGYCTESLGNLVLIPKAHNDRAGNLDFARKKEVLFNAADGLRLAVNADVARQTEWTAREIKQREANLLRLLEELWSFGLLARRQNTENVNTAGRKRAAGA
jgi:hypothetical protein